MDISLFSVQMVISLILRGTLAVSVVIVIRVFRVLELSGFSELLGLPGFSR
jgi:hypothetical protein